MAEPTRVPSYPAVSVEPDKETCCKAVLEIAEKRFLASEAPALPVDACDRFAQCQCRYKKWDDRRQEERRMTVAGMGNQYFNGDEKRALKRGRRDTD